MVRQDIFGKIRHLVFHLLPYPAHIKASSQFTLGKNGKNYWKISMYYLHEFDGIIRFFS